MLSLLGFIYRVSSKGMGNSQTSGEGVSAILLNVTLQVFPIYLHRFQRKGYMIEATSNNIIVKSNSNIALLQ
jgi:hypothetical protein